MKIKFRIALLVFMVFSLTLSTTFADSEISISDLKLTPSIYVLSPEPDESYESGGKLEVKVKGKNVAAIAVEIEVDGATFTEIIKGEEFEHTFEFEPTYNPIRLNIKGFLDENMDPSIGVCEEEKIVITPKQEIINKMINLAYDNSKDSRYKFAPAEEDWHIGVCKNFVMRIFDTFSEDYRMAEFPELELHMPKNNSLEACKPYQYGIEWRIESASEGSPFEIAKQLKYNEDISSEENAEIARDMMHSAQKGDFFQMVGYYGGGNGPHSLYIIENYDSNTDIIHWTDSNMLGKRIDGVRWGYMQYDAQKTAEWFIECFNTKKRGATLYRLRDDLIKP